MTRGLKLNNPLNITQVPGQTWIGQAADQPDKTLVNWITAPYCYRAGKRIVMRHYQPGKTQVQNVIAAWAPAAAGNDVPAYVADVEKRMGHTGPLDLPRQLLELFHAMTVHEQGYCPYDDSVILEGLALDGLPPPAEPPPVATPVPAPVHSDPEPTPAPLEDAPVPAAPAPTPPPVDAFNPFLPSQSTTSSLGLGAAASVLLVWILDQFHLQMNPEQAMAAGVVLSSLAGYFAKGGRAIHTQGA